MIKFDKSKYKTEKSILISLIKLYKKSIEKILVEEFNLNVNKCGLCNNYAKVKIIFEENNTHFILKDINYPLNNYCKTKECPGKKMNSMSKEFIKKTRNLSDLEVDEYLSNKSNKGINTLRKNGFFDDKSNNPYSKDFWNKRGINGDAKVKKRIEKSFKTLRDIGFFDDKSNNPYSKDFWIKKGYTHKEAQIKVNERNHIKPEYWMKLGYSLNNSKILSKKSANTTSKQAFIKRYGRSLGTSKFLEFSNKIKKYWTVNGLSEIYNISKEDASILLGNKIDKIISNFKQGVYSKESMNFFNNLIKDFPKSLKNMCYFADNEFGRYDKNNNKYYFYDFVIPKLKICIEYHGIAFHSKNINDKSWRQPFTKKTSIEVIENDNNKKILLESLGYNYFIVWSDDVDDVNIYKIKNIILKKYIEYNGKN